MSSASSPASKQRYDITMSRRTRKQLAKSEQAEAKNKKDNNNNGNNSINGNNRGVVSLENLLEVKEGDDDDGVCEHKSLKQLINGDHNNHHQNHHNHHHHHNEKMKKKDHSGSGGNNNKGGIRSSLGQHFNSNNEEENNNNNNKSQQQQQLQVVRRNSNQKESVQEGLKFKKLVRRYAKILGQHLIMKPKRDLNHFPAADHSTNKPFFKLSK